MNPKLRLAVAAYPSHPIQPRNSAAATKSRGSVVSRAQAAVATHVVVAELTEGPGPAVKVQERLAGNEPAPGAEIRVTNLSDAQGFEGSGAYLLLLVKDSGDTYRVVGHQRSPGYEAPLSGTAKPMIYRWSDDVRGQVQKLFP